MRGGHTSAPSGGTSQSLNWDPGVGVGSEHLIRIESRLDTEAASNGFIKSTGLDLPRLIAPLRPGRMLPSPGGKGGPHILVVGNSRGWARRVPCIARNRSSASAPRDGGIPEIRYEMPPACQKLADGQTLLAFKWTNTEALHRLDCTRSCMGRCRQTKQCCGMDRAAYPEPMQTVKRPPRSACCQRSARPRRSLWEWPLRVPRHWSRCSAADRDPR